MTENDRTFGQIMALLAEHDQTRDLHATLINDAFIDLVCKRLSPIPVPPVSAGEVRRAWAEQREALPNPPVGFFDEGDGV